LPRIENNLSKDPYQGKALTGEFKRLRCWRSGKFRIIYEIQQELLVRFGVQNRPSQDIYR